MTNAASAPITLEQAVYRTDWASACFGFALLAGSLAALFSGSLQSMATIWLTSSSYHHGLVAAPVSAWLIFRRQDWIVRAPVADRLGAVVLAAACIAQLFSRASGVDLIGHVSFVVAIIGAAITVFGRELAARWAFPLGFLFFMVPFGEELTPVMQDWASSVLAAALNLTGIETARDGFMLTTSTGRFEVAASCAGLRFLLASAMISALISHLAFDGWRKRTAFVLLALGAAILANWLRAYLIVLVATITERKLGVGPEHVMLGWIFYSALIVVMLAIANRYADHRAPTPALIQRSTRRPASAAMLIGLTAIAAAAFYDYAVLTDKKLSRGPIAIPPLHASGFEVKEAPSAWRPFAPDADATAAAGRMSDDAELTLSFAAFAYDRKGAEIAGAQTRAADGVIWRRTAISSATMTFQGARHRVKIETLENSESAKVDVATLYWLGDRLYASPVLLKLQIALRKLTGGATAGGAVFIAANRDDNLDAALSIRRFLASLELAATPGAASDKGE